MSTIEHTYARGNYGMNLFCIELLASQSPNGLQYGTPDLFNTNATAWGGGIGGINVSLRLADIPTGLSNMIGIDELRSGISPLDPRGTWAFGMVGASISAINDKGPNPSDRADGITSCTTLELAMSAAEMMRLGLPCDGSPVPGNYMASARSLHPGTVNCLSMDGSVQTVSDSIDDTIWIRLHSRFPNP